MLVVQPGGGLRDRRVADLPQWLEPGDQLVVNDTKVISAQLRGRRIGRDTEPKIEATLIKRLDGSRWQALVKPAKKLTPGDMVRFGNEGKVCLLGHLDAEVEHKGDDGEVTLSFSFHGPALDQAIADLGSPPLPPYIASKRAPDERDASRLPDHVRGQRRRGRRPHGGIAFYACIGSRVARARRSGFTASPCMSGQGPSCRSRPKTPPGTRCMPNGASISRETRRRAQRGAGQRRPHRRRRHHLAAAAGKRRRGRRHDRAVHAARPRSSSRRAIVFARSIFS